MTAGATYPLALLRAAHIGLAGEQVLVVTATDADGTVIRGRVVVMGSLLTVVDARCRVVEAIRPEWVTAATVVNW